MTAQEYIRKVNFMVNVGTNFDYEAEYEKLTPEDKEIVDEHFDNTVFKPSH